jgi:hypothetical protein
MGPWGRTRCNAPGVQTQRPEPPRARQRMRQIRPPPGCIQLTPPALPDDAGEGILIAAPNSASRPRGRRHPDRNANVALCPRAREHPRHNTYFGVMPADVGIQRTSQRKRGPYAIVSAPPAASPEATSARSRSRPAPTQSSRRDVRSHPLPGRDLGPWAFNPSGTPPQLPQRHPWSSFSRVAHTGDPCGQLLTPRPPGRCRPCR